FQSRLGFCSIKARVGGRQPCENPVDRILPDFFRADFANFGIHTTFLKEAAACRSPERLLGGKILFMVDVCQANFPITTRLF
ncbi:hypothetical protein, partial [Bradyrhizobium sp. dw_78]|uniref:hypothetical protein n=1 Tax=Bradyrhizobium sp. dw_78 TaxID=2719793 RepID=UPI001BD2A54A